MVDLSVIVVSWNTKALLSDCLDSVLRHADECALEIIVVDNHSSDGSPRMVRERYPQVRLIENDENAGFAHANNQGVHAARGRHVLLLNSDAMLTPGAARSLTGLADGRPRVGVVGARLLNADGSFQASFARQPSLRQEVLMLTGLGRLLFGRHYPSFGAEEDSGPQPAGYVPGTCMLVRREAYLEVGGFDEGYFMYAEDVDLCLGMHRRGWEVWYQPGAPVVHLGSASSASRRPQREADLYRARVQFFRKNHGHASASMLKAIILALTPPKIVVNEALRLSSGGRRGRRVVGMRQLYSALKGV